MAYTVNEVSKLSGVTIRTLRYYDQIGLLKPAYVGENGYRYYEDDQLRQLQHILFFRELDLPLTDIQGLMQSNTFDQRAALQQHRQLLTERIERLQRLVATLDRTMNDTKGEQVMNAEQWFDGFDRSKQENYVEELKERYGAGADRHIRESEARTNAWSRSDWQEVQQESERIHERIASLIREGFPPESDPIQEVIVEHFQWVSRFYTPTREVYAGLGELYVDHADFRKLYDRFHPALAETLRDAMRIYAERHL